MKEHDLRPSLERGMGRHDAIEGRMGEILSGNGFHERMVDVAQLEVILAL